MIAEQQLYTNDEILINDTPILLFDFDSCEWKKSTCGINGDEVIDLSIRNSFISTSEYSLTIHKFKELCELLGVENSEDKSNGWSLLKYEVGSKFEKHVDSTGDYTFLVLPSTAINNNVGGELIIGNEEPILSDEHVKLIVFSKGIEHEVTEITTGVRYVFKHSFNSKTIIYEAEEKEDISGDYVSSDNKQKDIPCDYVSLDEKDIIEDIPGGYVPRDNKETEIMYLKLPDETIEVKKDCCIIC